MVGSINQDITAVVGDFPKPGETISSLSTEYNLGGKGANQAAAAAIAGANTFFVGSIGNDAAGVDLKNQLKSFGVDTSGIEICNDAQTGVAFITVDKQGENTIILDAGANSHVSGLQKLTAMNLESGDVLVLQGEISPDENLRLGSYAKERGAKIILNLAPVYSTSRESLSFPDLLVVNETEAAALIPGIKFGDESGNSNAADLLAEFADCEVVITLGASGAMWSNRYQSELVPGILAAKVVDTTGAGDACVGFIAAALAGGLSLQRAVIEGMRAGSKAVAFAGAAKSYRSIEPIDF